MWADEDVEWTPACGGPKRSTASTLPVGCGDLVVDDLDAEARARCRTLPLDDLSPGPKQLLRWNRFHRPSDNSDLSKEGVPRPGSVSPPLALPAASGSEPDGGATRNARNSDRSGEPCNGGDGADYAPLRGAFVDDGKDFMATKAFLGAIYPPSVYQRPGKDVFDSMDETFNNWSEPEIDLELHYVMGYRARDSRYNLHWIDENRVVFPVAALGVFYRLDICDEEFFFGHEDDVVCMDLHRANPAKPGDQNLVASGSIGAGRECQLCIWYADTREIKHDIRGFLQFACVSVGFNPSATLVCALGLDEHHSAALFSVETGLLMAHCAADKNRLLYCKFCTSHTVNNDETFVSIGVSHICFWTPMGTAGKGSNYFLTTDDPVDRRLQWARGTGIDDIDHIAIMALDFTYAHTVVGGTDGIIYLIDSAKRSCSAKVAVADKPEKIYQILTLHGPRADKRTGAEVIAVGTQQGIISFWDVLTSEDALDVRVAESKRVTADGSRVNANLLESFTNNDIDYMVNSVRSMSWLESRGQLAIGTGLTAIYTIDLAKWTAAGPPPRSAAVDESKRMSRRLMNGHWGNLKDADGYGEVWGVDCHPRTQECVSCADDSTLRLWDIEEAVQVAKIDVKYLAYRCSYCPTGEFIAVGHRNGCVTIVRDNGKSAPKRLTIAVPHTRHDRQYEVEDIKFSPNGKYVAALNGVLIDILTMVEVEHRDEATGTVTKQRELHLVETCRGHTSAVQLIDWNIESTLIQSVSRGYDLLYFSIPDCAMVTGAKALADELWYTQSCIIGWGVQGIWPRYADGTDVNCCSKSRSQKWLVTTDDWGRVKLFNYPCVGSGFDRKTGKLRVRPSFKDFRGHSSHVTNADWTFNDSYIVTTGGADLSIFFWKVKYNATPKPAFFLNAEAVQSATSFALGRRGLSLGNSTGPNAAPRAPGGQSADGGVGRVPNTCFMCQFSYPDDVAKACPRCNAPRMEPSKAKWRKAWNGKLSDTSRYMRPTSSFAKYSKEMQRIRKEAEERTQTLPEVVWRGGQVKVVEVVKTADDDEEAIAKKLRGVKKTIDTSLASAPGAPPAPPSPPPPPKAKPKKTSGPDFRDF